MIEHIEQETDALEAEMVRARHIDKRQKWALFALTMALLVAVAIIGLLWAQARDYAAQQTDAAASEQAQKKDVAAEAQKALCSTTDGEIYDRDLCEKWAAIAEQPVIDPADTPTVKLSQAEIVAGFREYCATGECKGTDGQPPTPTQIAQAFSAYCAETNCNGKDGTDGADGTDGQPLAPEYSMVLAAVTEVCTTGVCTGAPGTNGIDGIDGADATPEMVLAAVNAYCAEGACLGPKGDKGDTGDSGAQGVSIVDVDCIGEGDTSSWQITLSDGQVLNGGGPCKIGPPIPEVVEAPAP